MDARIVGKELFGRPVRLDVARWVLRHEVFFQGEVSLVVHHPPSAVREELERFVGLGMLARFTNDGSRRVYYSRTQSPLWEIIRAADTVLSPSTADESTEVST